MAEVGFTKTPRTLSAEMAAASEPLPPADGAGAVSVTTVPVDEGVDGGCPQAIAADNTRAETIRRVTFTGHPPTDFGIGNPTGSGRQPIGRAWGGESRAPSLAGLATSSESVREGALRPLRYRRGLNGMGRPKRRTSPA